MKRKFHGSDVNSAISPPPPDMSKPAGDSLLPVLPEGTRLQIALDCLAETDPRLCAAFAAKRAGLAVRREASAQARGVLRSFAEAAVSVPALTEAEVLGLGDGIASLTGESAWAALAICYAVDAYVLCEETDGFDRDPGRPGRESRAISVTYVAWASVVASVDQAGRSPMGESREREGPGEPRLRLAARRMGDGVRRLGPGKIAGPWRQELLSAIGALEAVSPRSDEQVRGWMRRGSEPTVGRDLE